MVSGEFEPNETPLVHELIKDVDCVVNVGANIGYYSCLALQAGKSIIAFEPLPENLHFLLRNVKANGWQSKAQVFPMALSNRVGIIEIYGGGTGASLIEGWAQSSSDEKILVPTTTLDNILGHRFHNNERVLLIVDIEGAEKMMLDGASKILNHSPQPLWVIEITSHEHQPKGVSVNPFFLATFELFWEAGYEAYSIEENLRKITRQEIEDTASSRIAKTGSHNYLFRSAS